MSCLFCRIIHKEIPSAVVYEDDQILAFRDINPTAPTHILFIPKTHIEGAAAVTQAHAPVIGHIFKTIPEIAKQLGLTDFRVVTNNGASAGQTVDHLHFHIVGGKELGDFV